MALDARTASLIAVGAAVTANCQPCLSAAAGAALHNGVSPDNIADAIAVGRKIRGGAARGLDSFASGLDLAAGDVSSAPEVPCQCQL